MYDSQGRLVLSIDELVYILLQGWMGTLHEIKKIQDFRELSQEIFNNVSTEYLIFYFHYFERVVFNTFGETERDRTMKEVQIRLIRVLDNYDDAVLQMKDKPFQIDMDLKGVLKYFSKYALAVNFSKICDERCAEYTSYQYAFFKAGIGESMRGNAHLAFRKRIAEIIKNNPEDPLVDKINVVTEKYLRFYTKRLKEAGILQTE